MGKRPGKDITRKWLLSGLSVVYLLLKLNGCELCLCADSKKVFFFFFSETDLFLV